jgi:hypothetical protein
LSQYSTRPNKIHFEALKKVYKYLNATKDEGIYFQRKNPRLDLPEGPMPDIKQDENYAEDKIHDKHEQSGHSTLFGAVNSDYAGSTTHRKSVTSNTQNYLWHNIL